MTTKYLGDTSADKNKLVFSIQKEEIGLEMIMRYISEIINGIKVNWWVCSGPGNMLWLSGKLSGDETNKLRNRQTNKVHFGEAIYCVKLLVRNIRYVKSKFG